MHSRGDCEDRKGNTIIVFRKMHTRVKRPQYLVSFRKKQACCLSSTCFPKRCLQGLPFPPTTRTAPFTGLLDLPPPTGVHVLLCCFQ